MQSIAGGTFRTGDVFDEGVRFATPVDDVTVSSFHLNKYEVTVEEFTAFVKDTGYVTSAERGSEGPVGKNDEYGARLAARGAWVLDPAAGSSWAAISASRRTVRRQQPCAALAWKMLRTLGTGAGVRPGRSTRSFAGSQACAWITSIWAVA